MKDLCFVYLSSISVREKSIGLNLSPEAAILNMLIALNKQAVSTSARLSCVIALVQLLTMKAGPRQLATHKPPALFAF